MSVLRRRDAGSRALSGEPDPRGDGLHEGKWLTLVVHHDDQRVRAEPFDGIELDLVVLWADLAP